MFLSYILTKQAWTFINKKSTVLKNFTIWYIICFQPLNCHTGARMCHLPLTPGHNDIYNNSDTVVIIVIIIMIENFRRQQLALSLKSPIEYRIQ